MRAARASRWRGRGSPAPISGGAADASRAPPTNRGPAMAADFWRSPHAACVVVGRAPPPARPRAAHPADAPPPTPPSSALVPQPSLAAAHAADLDAGLTSEDVDGLKAFVVDCERRDERGGGARERPLSRLRPPHTRPLPPSQT